MDVTEALDLKNTAEKLVEMADLYATKRTESGHAKAKLHILLAGGALKNIRFEKKNVGIEMAILMLCEDNKHARDLYNDFIVNEAEYKALERVIMALEKKLSVAQSVMKFFKEQG